MNSVTPSTKLSNSIVYKQLVNIAIMSPVYPKELKVPLLLAHPDGEVLTRKLNTLGLNAHFVGVEIGKAAS